MNNKWKKVPSFRMNKRTHLSFRIKDVLKEVSKVQNKDEWMEGSGAMIIEGKVLRFRTQDEFIKVSMVN